MNMGPISTSFIRSIQRSIAPSIRQMSSVTEKTKTQLGFFGLEIRPNNTLMQSKPSRFKPQSTIVFIQHSKTPFNEEGRTQGRWCRDEVGKSQDPPLSDAGRKLVEEKKEQLLASIPGTPDIVLSSPLARARETAEMIFSEHDIELDETFTELDVGSKIDGKTKPEQDPEAIKLFTDLSDAVHQIEGDGDQATVKMVARGVRLIELNDEHSGKTIVIITHSNTLGLIKNLLGQGQTHNVDGQPRLKIRDQDIDRRS